MKIENTSTNFLVNNNIKNLFIRYSINSFPELQLFQLCTDGMINLK